MRDEDLRASANIDDRRGGSGLARGGLGIGAVAVLTLIGWVTGIDPAVLIGGAEQVRGVGQTEPAGRTGAPTDAVGGFVARVLGETEDVWSATLPAQTGRAYQAPVLVLFSGATTSGCGTAQSAMGPFYCPLDRKLYLDTSFFNDMRARMGGGGEFAYAYVIAHEVGHHIQNLLGVLPRVQEAQRAAPNRAVANALSVRTELMADCLAGVWANRMQARRANLDEADLRQAVDTAAAIGDDRLQRQAGRVVPDSFTHGSAEQRVRALVQGLRGGTVQSCDAIIN